MLRALAEARALCRPAPYGSPGRRKSGACQQGGKAQAHSEGVLMWQLCAQGRRRPCGPYIMSAHQAQEPGGTFQNARQRRSLPAVASRNRTEDRPSTWSAPGKKQVRVRPGQGRLVGGFTVAGFVTYTRRARQTQLQARFSKEAAEGPRRCRDSRVGAAPARQGSGAAPAEQRWRRAEQSCIQR